ncbi:hypothetical protein LOK49_LG10G01781 [Camellia lanceoleosa]|uniref:Uncharacterized protein n=1 Tax=Camellia lanceoleosa TaxID=1840588 RepID=A0ACC0GE18_9ERIC|nr:hypothetical protein LOK49_LG10G01781 [Camellia lanceoleosa]
MSHDDDLEAVLDQIYGFNYAFNQFQMRYKNLSLFDSFSLGHRGATSIDSWVLIWEISQILDGVELGLRCLFFLQAKSQSLIQYHYIPTG